MKNKHQQSKSSLMNKNPISKDDFELFCAKIRAQGVENVARQYGIYLYECIDKGCDGELLTNGKKCKYGHYIESDIDKTVSICSKNICYYQFMTGICAHGDKCFKRHISDTREGRLIKSGKYREYKEIKDFKEQRYGSISRRYKSCPCSPLKYNISSPIKRSISAHTTPTNNKFKNLYNDYQKRQESQLRHCSPIKNKEHAIDNDVVLNTINILDESNLNTEENTPKSSESTASSRSITPDIIHSTEFLSKLEECIKNAMLPYMGPSINKANSVIRRPIVPLELNQNNII